MEARGHRWAPMVPVSWRKCGGSRNHGDGPETDLMPTYPSQLSGGNPKCVWPLSLIAHALMASPTRIDSPGPPGHAVGGGRGGGVGMGAP